MDQNQPKSNDTKNTNEIKALIQKIINEPAMRQEITKQSHFLFFNTYFSHYAVYETAEFQREIFAITEDNSIKTSVIEAFRGSAKTTIMSLSYPIWAILGKQQKKFVVLLAQTQEQAKQYLKNIKEELENNEILTMDLGPFEEPEDEWRDVSIVIPRYGARITAVSSEQKVRGLRHHQYRPDLIVADDLEDLNSVKTIESRDKLYNWLMGDVIPAGDISTRLIVIGTRLHEDSLIMRLRHDIENNNMDGVVKYYPILSEDGKIAWPGKFPTMKEIGQLKKGVPSESAWYREYLLEIINDNNQVIQKDWLKFYRRFPEKEAWSGYRFKVISVDPAISQKTTADYTAIVCAEIYGSGDKMQIYILPNPVNEKLTSKGIIERIQNLKALNGDHGVRVIIETVAMQQIFIEMLMEVNIRAEGMNPGAQDKRARLELAGYKVQSGKVFFPTIGAEDLITQLLGFGKERRDDLADAFSQLILYASKETKSGIIIPTNYYPQETYVDRYIASAEENEKIRKKYERLADFELIQKSNQDRMR